NYYPYPDHERCVGVYRRGGAGNRRGAATDTDLWWHDMDDRALLERLKAGDPAAFDTIFPADYPHLAAFGPGFLPERVAPEDVAQEVMLELWRRRDALAISESLRAYLLRATRNRSLNQLRHANVAKRAEPQLVGEETVNAMGASQLVASELRTALAAAVDEL